MPGDPLPEPVRVAVRNGGHALPGARVRFEASDAGSLAEAAAPTAADPATLTVDTAADGVAGVRWLLDASGPTTQTVTVHRLDDHDQPVDVPVVVTGRLSVARQVAWDPDPRCPRFAGTRTVQEALETLVADRELRLLGGDGQSVTSVGQVVQRPVRVVVDDGCGPIEGATVVARAESSLTGDGLVAEAKEGDLAPGSLTGTASSKAVVTTGPDGVAMFWWQPSFGNMRWSTLDVTLEDSGGAPVRVTAELDLGGGRTSGLHVRGLNFGIGSEFTNDDVIGVTELVSGILVSLDGAVPAASVKGKPVIRVELDLPWPIGPDRTPWTADPNNPQVPIGTQTVTLNGSLDPQGQVIAWFPQAETRTWLVDRLFRVLTDVGAAQVLGRYVLDGWAIVSEGLPRRNVNTHAPTVLDRQKERTVFDLPSDDDVTGGTFVQWFHLRQTAPLAAASLPVVLGRTAAVAQRELEAAGFVVQLGAEASADVRKGLVLRTVPDGGTWAPAGSTVRVVVSSGRSG